MLVSCPALWPVFASPFPYTQSLKYKARCSQDIFLMLRIGSGACISTQCSNHGVGWCDTAHLCILSLFSTKLNSLVSTVTFLLLASLLLSAEKQGILRASVTLCERVVLNQKLHMKFQKNIQPPPSIKLLPVPIRTKTPQSTARNFLTE